MRQCDSLNYIHNYYSIFVTTEMIPRKIPIGHVKTLDCTYLMYTVCPNKNNFQHSFIIISVNNRYFEATIFTAI